MSDGDRNVAAALTEFLSHLHADREAGVDRPLAEYQTMQPGYEREIAAEFSRLGGGPRSTAERQPSVNTPKPLFAGRYRMENELGRGAQGAVSAAEDTVLNRKVAVKLLRSPELASTEALKRFTREAQTASRLDHPGICPVYDSGVADGVPFIVMRFIDGVTLARELEADVPATTRAEVRARLLFVENVARGLHSAHEKGVIHRDINPRNIMVTPDGDPVILDFGLARESSTKAESMTSAGHVVGTLAYMSPEQLGLDSTSLDGRTDVWSLGVTLYECLTGVRPFSAPTRDSLFRSILADDPKDPRRLNRAIDRDVAVVVLTALEKERNRRYQTAADFAEDLRRAIDGQPVLARPIGPFGRLARWSRRSPVVAGLTAAVFVALATGLVGTTVQKNRFDATLQDWNRLVDVRRLESLAREAEGELIAASRKNIPAMKAWLDRAGRLVTRLPELESTLDEARQSGRRRTVDDRLYQERSAPLVRLRDALRFRLGHARGGADSAMDAASFGAELSRLERDIANLEVWTFDEESAQLRYDGLDQLVNDIRALDGPKDPERPTIAAMRERLAASERLEVQWDSGAAAWEVTTRAIAESSSYGGLRLMRQERLVPIGPDPQSGLFEFAVEGTGTVPHRDSITEELVVQGDAAIVLVLLPAATFRMGTPGGGEKGAERPHDVTLTAFFMSKFELTQAQFATLRGEDAGVVARLGPNGRLPVVELNRSQADRVVRQGGLRVPTEAQWEYACRAGSPTRFYCGDAERSLDGHENVADASFPLALQSKRVDWDDGAPLATFVGRYPANGFGLHDMHGNVTEWTCDPYHEVLSSADHRPGDGAVQLGPSNYCVTRGGSYYLNPEYCRSAMRHSPKAVHTNLTLGVRPSRGVEP